MHTFHGGGGGTWKFYAGFKRGSWEIEDMTEIIETESSQDKLTSWWFFAVGITEKET